MSAYQKSRQESRRKDKYIDLKINGRLFPSWVLANFKKYKLPEIIKKPGEDPCKKEDVGDKKAASELTKYQQFLSQYLDFKSPYRNMLIYHGLGSGKTASAINIYNVLYNYTPGWNVFIMIKAALKTGWLDELQTWLSKDEKQFREKNIHFLHYDSPVADRQFMDILKTVDNSKKSLYIVDEVHNFIRNVYSNISDSKGKRAQKIYDYIIQEKRDNPDTRVILLSATPAINKPFELALLFNLLRPNIFPKSENEFNQLFITTTTHQSLNKNNKNLFQRRIMGLVSFYIGSTPDYFASKTTHYIDVPMSNYQRDIYNYYEDIEGKMEARARMAGQIGSSTYKSYTRQSANFVFPSISQRINGENRPRPGKFRISEREAEKLGEGRTVKKEKEGDTVLNVAQYKEALDAYITGLDNYFRQKDEKDKKQNHTIIKDVETFKAKYNEDFMEFHEKEKKKSNLYEAMTTCSMKMTNIIFNIMKSKGPTLVYSNYVLMEGLQVFKIYLKYFGFYSFMDGMVLREGRVGYSEFHGGFDKEARRKGMNAFNRPQNKYGELLKIMLVSPAGSEGLSLMNVRQVHIMEPYWNEVRVNQMVGRGIRLCSHKDLPVEERMVDVYRYKSVRVGVEKWTTDQYIEDLARSKESLLQDFLDSMKEVAVDCGLFKSHNMLVQEFRCFKFDENSLFEDYVGPAYKDDIYDDQKMDNGSNSNKSVNIKIKVMKMQAVIQKTSGEEGTVKYSEPKDYWLYPESGVVYDYELHYAVGKVGLDDDGNLLKLDKNTYVIDKMVPLPIVEE